MASSPGPLPPSPSPPGFWGRWFQTLKPVGVPLPVLGLALGIALWAWNWSLTLALGLGAIVTYGLYQAQLHPWQDWLLALETWFAGPQRLLLVALGGGLVTGLGTYLTSQLWLGFHDLGLVFTLGLQGFGVLICLGGLLVQLLGHHRHVREQELDGILVGFGSGDHWQRLLAIRQAERMLARSPLTPEDAQLLLQSLGLVAQQDHLPDVRNLALDALDRLDRQNP